MHISRLKGKGKLRSLGMHVCMQLLSLMLQSSGLRRTHELAVDYAHMATKAIDFLKDCKEKSLLLELTRKCTSRTK